MYNLSIICLISAELDYTQGTLSTAGRWSCQKEDCFNQWNMKLGCYKNNLSLQLMLYCKLCSNTYNLECVKLFCCTRLHLYASPKPLKYRTRYIYTVILCVPLGLPLLSSHHTVLAKVLFLCPYDVQNILRLGDCKALTARQSSLGYLAWIQ